MAGQSIEINFLSYFRDITTFVFDMDGVLTDGQMLVTNDGDILRTLNAKDSYAMHHAVQQGFRVALLSRGETEGFRRLLERVGLQHIFMSTFNKLEVYEAFKLEQGLHRDEILYMGDDMLDIPVLKEVGIAACPLDAVHEVKEIAMYVSDKPGGKGCVRDVIEKTMRIQKKWI